MTFLRQVIDLGRESGRGQREIDTIQRHFEGAVRVLERARALGITVLCGTGYPFNAGHCVASITYRKDLMALPRPGQVIDLR
jgi:Ni,Fe-hydrogenase I cytochrome b subunit